MAGAWGWQPDHLHVPNVMEIWKPKSPGTLWATPSLLRDSFTLPFITHKKIVDIMLLDTVQSQVACH